MTIREEHLKFLDSAIEQTGLTASGIAAKAGLSSTTLTRFIKDDSMRSLSQVTLNKIAELLGKESYPNPNLYSKKEKQQIPIVGYVGAGSEVFPIDDHAKGNGMNEIEAPDHLSLKLNIKKTVAVEVRGDSMMPFISNGDLLFYDERLPGVPIEYLNTRCVLWLEDGRCMVKWVRQGTKAGHYTLESINPAEPHIKDVLVVYSAKVKTIVPR